MAHPLADYRQSFSPPLSKAKLAKTLGLSRSYLHRVESGERRIGKDRVSDIAEKTGIAPAVLRPDIAELMGVTP